MDPILILVSKITFQSFIRIIFLKTFLSYIHFLWISTCIIVKALYNSIGYNIF